MAQSLGALTALQKALSSSPSNHIVDNRIDIEVLRWVKLGTFEQKFRVKQIRDNIEVRYKGSLNATP